jgi:molybdopterin converting factor small subunit
MSTFHLKYLAHIWVLTGKMDEMLESEAKTILDLIKELDKTYPGLKDLFIPPDIGILNVKTNIYLSRAGKPARVVNDPNENLMDGDTIVLY